MDNKYNTKVELSLDLKEILGEDAYGTSDGCNLHYEIEIEYKSWGIKDINLYFDSFHSYLSLEEELCGGIETLEIEADKKNIIITVVDCAENSLFPKNHKWKFPLDVDFDSTLIDGTGSSFICPEEIDISLKDAKCTGNFM